MSKKRRGHFFEGLHSVTVSSASSRVRERFCKQSRCTCRRFSSGSLPTASFCNAMLDFFDQLGYSGDGISLFFARRALQRGAQQARQTRRTDEALAIQTSGIPASAYIAKDGRAAAAGERPDRNRRARPTRTDRRSHARKAHDHHVSAQTKGDGKRAAAFVRRRLSKMKRAVSAQRASVSGGSEGKAPLHAAPFALIFRLLLR